MPILHQEIVQNLLLGEVLVNMWSANLEPSCISQALKAARLLPIFRALGIMPDGHHGYALPVGGVAPLLNAIAPYCVGMDIGCGMMLIRLSITDMEPTDHIRIRNIIKENIPIGSGANSWRNVPIAWDGFEKGFKLPSPVIQKELSVQKGKQYANAELQLGTLGGNNHFIEIQKGSDGYLYVMIHSGSRNLGKQVCTYYHNIAIEKGIVPEGQAEYAYLPTNRDEWHEYWDAMNFALDFAYQNRKVMMDIVESAIKDTISGVEILQRENIHHNYAALETHFGTPVFVHRKGATLASEGFLGIIPGSKGKASYLVKGKGNPESFNSCSHGAGRSMSREAAKKNLTMEQCLASLHSAGLTADARDVRLDEGDEAYKDIHEVMRNQSDLVDPMVELRAYQYPSLKETQPKERRKKKDIVAQ